jgi:CheY-like chemotaxis protein
MSAQNLLLRVLLVEDSEDDRFFFEHTFNLAQLEAELSMAKDGIEAIELLQDLAKAPGQSELPQVMFLDLKMPDCDGFDVLRWMRERSLTDHIRVYVLSGSSEPQDVEMARSLGAAEYLVKPLRLKQLQQLLMRATPPAKTLNQAG